MKDRISYGDYWLETDVFVGLSLGWNATGTARRKDGSGAPVTVADAEKWDSHFHARAATQSKLVAALRAHTHECATEPGAVFS